MEQCGGIVYQFIVLVSIDKIDAEPVSVGR